MMSPESLIQAQKLDDAIADVKDDISVYRMWRNLTIAAGVLTLLVFGGIIFVAVVSALSPGPDLGGIIAGGIFADALIGGIGTLALGYKVGDCEPARLQRRLKAAQRAHRDFMIEQGLG